MFNWHDTSIWLTFVTQRRGEHNRFGVALHRFLGTFLIDLSQIPTNTQWFVFVWLFSARNHTLRAYRSNPKSI